MARPAPDDWMAYRRYLYLLARLLFYAALGILVYLALYQARGVLSLLFVSLLAAYVLDPVVDWFEARRVPRSVTAALLLVGGAGVMIGFGLWIVPTLVAELGQAGERLHAWLGKDHTPLLAWIHDKTGLEVSSETLQDLKTKAQEYAPQALSRVGEFLRSAAAQTAGVVSWLLSAVMIPVFVFYFVRDFDDMTAWVADQIPLDHREGVLRRARRVDGVVGEWLRGQVEVALILAVLYATGLRIVGIQLAIPIGILAGLLNVVPYLGFAFGFGLAMLMALLAWSGVGTVVGVVSVFAVAQILEGYVLTPKIVGEKVGLSPVTVLIALLLGGELFGLMGFVLAVPVAGASKTILLEAVDWYRTSEHYLGRTRSAEPNPGD